MKGFKYILLMFLFVAPVAMAETYIDLCKGIGTGTSRGEGNYKQSGHPSVWYDLQDQSRSKCVGLGGTFGVKWLGWNLKYIDFGRYKMSGRFVSQDDHYFDKKFDEHHTTVFNETDVKAYQAMLRFMLPIKKVTLSAGVGVIKYHSQTVWCGSEKHVLGCPNGWTAERTDRNVSSVVEAEIDWRFKKQHSIYFNYSSTGRVFDTAAAFKGIRHLSLGYRFYFGGKHNE